MTRLLLIDTPIQYINVYKHTNGTPWLTRRDAEAARYYNRHSKPLYMLVIKRKDKGYGNIYSET